MRIVRYHPRALAGDGGITKSVRCWSKGFTDAGAEAAIAFASNGDADRLPEGSVEWLPVRHVGSGGWQVPVGLADALDGADLLVLHSAWTLHNVAAAAIAGRLDVPYLLEPRGAYDPSIVRRRRLLKRFWWLACEQQLVHNARAVHIFFEAQRSHLHEIGYRGPVVVAPNGIEPPEGVSWDGGTGGYILFLGRFDPEHKGLDLLLKAIDHLPAGERPQLRLHGPDWRGGKERTVKMVGALGLEAWVEVGGAVYGKRKWDLLSRASGFVYPSRWEAYGNSVAEAVSIGVPTLVTPYPFGVYLASRDSALLVDPTPAALASGLRELTSARCREMGSRGSEILREEMSWPAVARTWLAQVEPLL